MPSGYVDGPSALARPLAGAHLGRFHVLALVDSAVANANVPAGLRAPLSEVELLGHGVTV